MTRRERRRRACAFAAAQVAHATEDWYDDCQRFVRTALELPGRYATAREAFDAVPVRFRHTERHPPPGVPVFWSPNHTALSMGDGWVCSTDIRRRGKPDTVPLDLIEQRWGLTYLGWTEFENDHRVYGSTP